jgi:hypothetical protein
MQPGQGYTFSSSSSGTTLNIEKPWPAEFIPSGTHLVIELYKPHPFRITKITEETVFLAGWAYNLYPQRGTLYTVLPGTVNATPCVFLGFEVCDEETTYIYVQTYPDTAIGFVISSTLLSDSESSAYVLIGTLNSDGINQFVKSNLLRERYKLGQTDAEYHHSYTDLV